MEINKLLKDVSLDQFIKATLFVVLLFSLFLFLSSGAIKAEEEEEDPEDLPPPEIPLPDSCFSEMNTVGFIYIAHSEDSPPLPDSVAVNQFPADGNDDPPLIFLTEVVNVSYSSEEAYDTHYEFNINVYYCKTELIGVTDFFCENDWEGEAPDWFISSLWPDLIEEEFNGSVEAFKNQYIDSDGFVGNYGILNITWNDETHDHYWGNPNVFGFSWVPGENSLLIEGPDPNNQNYAQCQEDLVACFGPYFNPEEFPGDPVCPKAPPPPQGGPGTPAYDEWYEDFGYWFDTGDFIDFGDGTIIGPGDTWSLNFGIPLGGRSVAAFPCLCSGNWVVEVIGPAGINFGRYTYAWLGQFAQNRLPWPQHWVIGLTSSQQTCVQWTGTSCSIQPNRGTFSPIVGTSPF